MKIVKGNIGNALTSVATDHVVAVAEDIYDEHIEEYQDVINRKANDRIENLNEKVDELNQTVYDDKKEIVSIKKDILNLDDKIFNVDYKLTNEITILNNDVDVINENITKINSNINTLKKDLSDVHKDVNNINNNVLILSGDVKDIKSDLNIVTEDLSDLEKRVKTIEDRYIYASNIPFSGAVLNYGETPFWRKSKFIVSLHSNVSERGKVYGSGIFPDGTMTTIYAEPEYGYHFTKWSDGNEQIERTLTVTDDFDLTAIFDKNTYTVNTSVNPSNIGIVLPEHTTCEYLDILTISAITKYGTVFDNWSDSAASVYHEMVPEYEDWCNSAYTRDLTVTGNTSITANFHELVYTVTVINEVTYDEEYYQVKYGQKLQQLPDPVEPGYDFVGWYYEDEVTPFSFDEKIYEDKTIVAVFVDRMSLVTFETTNGYLKISGDSLVNTDLTFMTSEYEGATFKHWLINGIAQTEGETVIEDKLMTGNTLEAHAVYEVKGDDNFRLVTDESQINVGDYILFAMSNDASAKNNVITMGYYDTSYKGYHPAETTSTIDRNGVLHPSSNTALLKVVEKNYNSGVKANAISLVEVSGTTNYYLYLGSNKNLTTNSTPSLFTTAQLSKNANNTFIIKCGASSTASTYDYKIMYNSSSPRFTTYATTSTTITYPYIYRKASESTIEKYDLSTNDIYGNFYYGDKLNLVSYNNDPEAILTSWLDSGTTETNRDIEITTEAIYKPLYNGGYYIHFTSKDYKGRAEDTLILKSINDATWIDDQYHKSQVQFIYEPFFEEANTGKTFDEITPVPAFETTQIFNDIEEVIVVYSVNKSNERGLAQVIVDVLDNDGNVVASQTQNCGFVSNVVSNLTFNNFTTEDGYNIKPSGIVRVSLKMVQYSLFFSSFHIMGSR